MTLDGVLLEEGVQYELEDFTLAHGGAMVFNTPPAVDASVIIYRETPITQQIDYVEGEPFPADTHEGGMDKDTRILQELGAGRGIGGRVDLAAVQHPDQVEVTNTSGTNAFLLPWTIDGLLAGVSMGEVVEHDDVPPTPGAATTKPNGFIWWVMDTPVLGAGDPTIRLYTTPLLVESITLAPLAARSELRYDANTGQIGFGYNTSDPGWKWEDAISPAPTALQQYHIKVAVQSGSAIEYNNSPVDTWIDAYSVIGEVDEFIGWFVSDPGISGEVVVHLAIAPDDGGGNPDPTFTVTRAIRLVATQNG